MGLLRSADRSINRMLDQPGIAGSIGAIESSRLGGLGGESPIGRTRSVGLAPRAADPCLGSTQRLVVSRQSRFARSALAKRVASGAPGAKKHAQKPLQRIAIIEWGLLGLTGFCLGASPLPDVPQRQAVGSRWRRSLKPARPANPRPAQTIPNRGNCYREQEGGGLVVVLDQHERERLESFIQGVDKRSATCYNTLIMVTDKLPG